ncbi:MAG TPA: KGG domain-containing protein [Flavisolibacter sp.]|nr:KGG domain-containing protein [Flavisolibacter sp.]
MAVEREHQQNQRHDENSRSFNNVDSQQENNSRLNSDANGRRKGTSNRGFAAMDPERQRKIASEGGRAAHKQGVAHEWSRDEAREAGRKGGQIVSKNREHMSEIGRKGGQRSGTKRSQRSEGASE